MFWFRTAPSAPPHRRPTKAIAFRWILVGPFLIQVIMAIGLTGYFSIRNSQKSAENLPSNCKLTWESGLVSGWTAIWPCPIG